MIPAFAVLSLVLAVAAEAQIMRRPPQRRTANWLGASIGITQGFGIRDGSTGSTWDFGSGLDYALRVERPKGSGELAIGLQASFARLPLTYSSSTFTGDAKADVSQLMAVLRYGNGYGFHPVYELQGGVIGFSDFRSTGMPPVNISSGTDYDPKLTIGYGFGFGLSPMSAVEIVQELGTVLHQRDGLSGSQSNYPRIYVTRIGGKIAF
jgi:hypothetical protein